MPGPFTDNHFMSRTVDLARGAPTRVLVIEDAAPDAVQLDVALRDTFLATASIEHALTLEAGLESLGRDWFDGVLIDLGLPRSESPEAFNRIWIMGGRTALVVLSGPDDDDLAAEVRRLGAQDCLLRSAIRPGELGRAVDRAIRRQRVLQQAERAPDAQFEANEQFLCQISRELRSPLSVVQRFGSLLLDDAARVASVDQQDFLNVLLRNVGQLQVMVDELLEVTRAQGERPTFDCRPLAIGDLLATATGAHQREAERRHLTLGVEAAELPLVVADAERIGELLAHLLGNALTVTPDGGHITVQAVADGTWVRVTVRDAGRDIRPEDEDHLFEQFFRANADGAASRDGLGLGLTICRDLIERQGGTIWAASSHGNGTAVAFTVPIHTSSTTR